MEDSSWSCDLLRLDGRGLSRETLKDRGFRGPGLGTPVVLTHLTSGWPAFEVGWTPERLASRFGHHLVKSHHLNGATIGYCGTLKRCHGKDVTTVKDILLSPGTRRYFLQAHHPMVVGLQDDLPVMEPLHHFRHQGPMLSLGGHRSFVDFHRHEENWLAQIHGRKAWALVPPDREVPGIVAKTPGAPCSPDVLAVFRRERFPLCTVGPTEVLYLPNHWSHGICNLVAAPGEADGNSTTSSSPGLNVAVGFIGALDAARIRSPELFLAAKRGHLAAFEALVLPDPSVLGAAIFHAVVAAGHAPLAAYLLDKSSSNIEALWEGSPPELPGQGSGLPPLQLAIARGYVAVLEKLTALGVEATATNGFQQALHLASHEGYVAVAEHLLKRGAEATSADMQGVQSLHFASREGHIVVAEHLAARGTEATCAHANGEEPVHFAARGGHVVVTEHLVARGAEATTASKNGGQPLHFASHGGHIVVAEHLAAWEAEATCADEDGAKPLHLASHGGYVAVVEHLAARGAEMRSAERHGRQPLHLASQAGHAMVVEHLVAQGAEMLSTDGNGLQGLHHASHGGHVAVVEYFAALGADTWSLAKSGMQLLHTACHGGHIAVVEHLVARGAEVRSTEESGLQGLHHASQGGHVAVVEYFVARGAETRSTLKSGMQPLHVASMSGHVVVVEELVAWGADARSLDESGGQPLHHASQGGHASVVEYLVASGAEATSSTPSGAQPLHVASQQGHVAVTAILESSGRVRDSNSRNIEMRRPGGDAAHAATRVLAQERDRARIAATTRIRSALE